MRNLSLHQNQAEAQRVKSFEKMQKHRHRDVVRQIGNQCARQNRQFGDLERIVLDKREGLARCALGDGRLELAGQLWVDLNGNHGSGNLKQPEG